ncbi:hypothetical protein QYE76_059353 [Lolium multiflorum]|uniref:non-specific serine/threonine protein kinase n=1 Tax=Lolium multiflorum TaxID=4521 RepID=A0AAD8RYJ8_LOLMU|nr:hypothetical protein QYE76_059353 [Lolium multiflorum]
MLLEIITGRKPVNSSCHLDDEILVEWSRPLLTRAVDENDFEEVVDPLLADNFSDVEMFRHSAARRPKIEQVVTILYSPTLNDVDLTNDVQTGMNQMFNIGADIRQIKRMDFSGHDFICISCRSLTGNVSNWCRSSPRTIHARLL